MTENNTVPPVTNPPADTLESLPEWAQKEIKDLRREGQNKGAKITSLEADLTTARNDWATKEATYVQQVATGTTELARYRAAVSSGVPADRVDDFAARLRGSTPEELTADAASLAQMLSVNATTPPPVNDQRGVDPSQGRGNGTNSPPLTPAAEFAGMFRDQLGDQL